MRRLAALLLVLSLTGLALGSRPPAPVPMRSPLPVASLHTTRAAGGALELRPTSIAQVGDSPIVIEAEQADDRLFQDDVFARVGNLHVAADEIQVKRSAADYQPAPDATASGGAYLDFLASADYAFEVTTPGSYTVWVRHYVPFAASWQYQLQLNRQPPATVRLTFPAARQWYWQKCTTVPLEAGSQHLSIRDMRNGKRADKILLTLDPAYVPDGLGPDATPARPVTAGEVRFQPFAPGCVRTWQKLEWTQTAPGDVRLQIATGDDSWQDVGPDGDLSALPAATPLRVRCLLAATAAGRPVIRDVAVAYLADPLAYAQLTNDHYQLTFSRATGALIGLRNVATGRDYIPFGSAVPMFDLILKQPGQPERTEVPFTDAKLVRLDQHKHAVELGWEVLDGAVRVSMKLEDDGSPLCGWQVTVDNRHPVLDVLELGAPNLHHVAVSPEPVDDTLAWPFAAGEFHPYPGNSGKLDVAYPSHGGLPFLDLFGRDEGLFLAALDPHVCATDLISRATSDHAAVDLAIRKRQRVAAGTRRTFGFGLGIHTGDWHWAADTYRDWFYRQHGRSEYPDWLRESPGWQYGSLANASTNPVLTFDPNFADYDSQLTHQFDKAANLGMTYMQIWGSNFNSPCPSFYLPRQECGGAETMTARIDQWRAAGGDIGFYYHGNAISAYWTLASHYFERPWTAYAADERPPGFDWFLRNREYVSEQAPDDPEQLRAWAAEADRVLTSAETIKGSTSSQRGTSYPSMNWYANGFPDYLRQWISRYVRDYHTSTAYLDTFAFWNDRQDFSPLNHHHGESDKLMYKMEFLHRLIADLSRDEPHFTVINEGVNDLLGTRTTQLLSGFARNGVNLYRYTLPDQILYQGQANGNWNMPRSETELMKAFVIGNHLDLISLKSYDSYRVLRLRQRLMPFFARAVFADRRGLTVEAGDAVAYVHELTASSDAILPNGNTRAILITLYNETEATGGQLSYRLPPGFILHRAYRCSLYDDPIPVELAATNGAVTLPVLADKASAWLLVDALGPACEWSAYPERDVNDGSLKVQLFNFGDRPLPVSVVAAAPGIAFPQPHQHLPALPGQLTTIAFAEPQPRATELKLATLDVAAAGIDRRLVLPLGKPLGYLLPDLDVDRPASRVVIDLETNAQCYSHEDPYEGKACYKIEPRGADTWQAKTIHLAVLPGTTYDVQVALKAGPAASDKTQCWLGIFERRDGKLTVIGSTGNNRFPRDLKWHEQTASFTTGPETRQVSLYIYNTFSTQPVWFDSLVVTRRPAAP